jgi:hypothetical protein
MGGGKGQFIPGYIKRRRALHVYNIPGMKTQIITLESHDDLISVRDRLSWAKTPRVLLVWPRYEEVTLRALDLKVLQRHADSLGAQLGLVTRRQVVQREARSLGLPVFESTAAAQKGTWPARLIKKQRVPRPPRRDLRSMQSDAFPAEAGWRTSPTARILTFVIGVAAALTVAGLFVPRAALTLQPESRTQSLVIPVAADPKISAVFVTGSVPARAESVIVEGSQTIPIIGQVVVPQTRARGVARFQNLTDAEVAIPAGTVIVTLGDSPVRFATVNDTHITAGVDQFVETPIAAERMGSSGNLPANALQAIEGSIGLSAAVTNPEPTGGGSDLSAIGASDEDRAQLYETLLKALTSQAEVNLQSQAEREDLLLLDTLAVSQTLLESFNPPQDQPGTSLELDLRLEFSVQVVSTQDLNQLARSALDSAIPAGFTPDAESLTIASVSAPVTDEEGVTRWQMKAERRVYREVDHAQVLNLARGRTPESAGAILARELSLERAARIEITPDWWPWLPLIPFRISVATE